MLGGDGRYFNQEAAQVNFLCPLQLINYITLHYSCAFIHACVCLIQIIAKIAAGNGVAKILVGK